MEDIEASFETLTRRLSSTTEQVHKSIVWLSHYSDIGVNPERL